MNVLFIYPSSGTLEVASGKYLNADAHIPPLGLLYLGRMLEINGHSVEIIDCNVEVITKEKIKIAIDSADVVGLTLYSSEGERNYSIRISKMIKEVDPQIPIVVGGPHATLYPEASLLENNADVCVQGAGEFVINLVVDALYGKRDFSSIPISTIVREMKLNIQILMMI